MNHSHFLVRVGVVDGVGVGFVIVVFVFGYGDSNMKNYSTCVTLFPSVSVCLLCFWYMIFATCISQRLVLLRLGKDTGRVRSTS